MNKKNYRLGIIGTGRIAHRFVPEARCVDGIEVVAVYNPRITSAEKFAEELNISYATDDVNAFLEKVDAVYIASPHETHVDYCEKMLRAGKHVLCEKPMCFSEKEARELFRLAEKKSLVLIEGIKTAYCPGFRELIKVVKSGKIGRIIDVEACFTRIPTVNVREIWDLEYGGSFTEFGTYSLLPIMKLLGLHSINQRIWSKQMKTGVDAYTKYFFDYGEATATAKTGLSVKSEGQLLIAGTEGYILVPSPWWLTKYFEVRYEDPNKKEGYEFDYDGAGLRYEIQAFLDKINGMDANEIISKEESIWLAGQMEYFLGSQKELREVAMRQAREPKIWAHRGCSKDYPENTLSAFRAAADIEGIAGIELDIQLSKDGTIVVIHDETLDRTTNGTGNVCDFTVDELKILEIQGRDNQIECIPTMEEVFQLLKDDCEKNGLLINIELKNSKIRYEGMEEKILELVQNFGLEKNVVYSSFLPESMRLIKELNPSAQTGILGGNAEWCRKKAIEMQADAIHPWNGGLDVNRQQYLDDAGCPYPVRVWNGEEPFFGQNRVLKEKEMTKYVRLGATDVITNAPENYLSV